MHTPAMSLEGRGWVRHFHNAVAHSGESISGKLTNHLKEHARQYGWPEDAVKHLYVEHSGGAFHPRFREEGREICESYEYGGFDRRPRAAMRMWALNSHEYASHDHDAALGSAIERTLF